MCCHLLTFYLTDIWKQGCLQCWKLLSESLGTWGCIKRQTSKNKQLNLPRSPRSWRYSGRVSLCSVQQGARIPTAENALAAALGLPDQRWAGMHFPAWKRWSWKLTWVQTLSFPAAISRERLVPPEHLSAPLPAGTGGPGSFLEVSISLHYL